MIYTPEDSQRPSTLLSSGLVTEEYRSPWRRDYARLIHSPSFRRLQGKTQLFPGVESDFFRNRLTHSLEVAQIAKSIAIKINSEIGIKKYYIEPDIVDFAGLAHDIGHPPFGHLGEEVLDRKMKDYGGFEGNAQTLRILSHLEKRQKDDKGRHGLNLTYRCLASILKYDRYIPQTENEREKLSKKNRAYCKRPIKGFYKKDMDLVNKIKENVLGDRSGFKRIFKTIECSIMDIADDIAYSTYDMEDSFKARFLQPTDLIFANDDLLNRVSSKVEKSIGKKLSISDIRTVIKTLFSDLVADIDFQIQSIPHDVFQDVAFMYADALHKASNALVEDGYARASFTSKLIGRFVRSVCIDSIDKKYPALSKVRVGEDEHLEIEILKHLIFESQISSPKLKIVAYRGKEIVEVIFDALNDKQGHELLPDDFGSDYKDCCSEEERMRVICDFICGMTDNYAIEFYARLKSENSQTIFKPF